MKGHGLDDLVSSAIWHLVADNDIAQLKGVEKDISLFREQLLARIRKSCEVVDRKERDRARGRRVNKCS